MNASIQLVTAGTNTWQINIQDLTSNQTFQNNFNYAASRLSAEWIVERPAIGRRGVTLAVLADVGLVTINNCMATVGTQSGAISTFPAIQSVMYDTLRSTTGVTQLTAVSALSADGLSFTVETSPTVIPEQSGWALLPLTVGTSILGAALKKRRAVEKGRKETEFSSQTQKFNQQQQLIPLSFFNLLFSCGF